MYGFLPATRPVSSNYGEDVEDEAPVTRPDLETPATNWNDLKKDGAYAARMATRLRIMVNIAAGTPAIVDVVGPEGVLVSQVTFTDNGVGDTKVNWAATGIIGDGNVRVERRSAAFGLIGPYGTTPSETNVKTTTSGGVAEDVNFTIWVD